MREEKTESDSGQDRPKNRVHVDRHEEVPVHFADPAEVRAIQGEGLQRFCRGMEGFGIDESHPGQALDSEGNAPPFMIHHDEPMIRIRSGGATPKSDPEIYGRDDLAAEIDQSEHVPSTPRQRRILLPDNYFTDSLDGKGDAEAVNLEQNQLLKVRSVPQIGGGAERGCSGKHVGAESGDAAGRRIV